MTRISRLAKERNGMRHGIIDAFVGNWGSGLGYLVIDGQPVPCDNAATVRALDACFGGVIAPGHWGRPGKHSGPGNLVLSQPMGSPGGILPG